MGQARLYLTSGPEGAQINLEAFGHMWPPAHPRLHHGEHSSHFIGPGVGGEGSQAVGTSTNCPVTASVPQGPCLAGPALEQPFRSPCPLCKLPKVQELWSATAIRTRPPAPWQGGQRQGEKKRWRARRGMELQGHGRRQGGNTGDPEAEREKQRQRQRKRQTETETYSGVEEQVWGQTRERTRETWKAGGGAQVRGEKHGPQRTQRKG